MSTPFQVLSPTMKSSKNPFEKLTPSSTTTTSPSITSDYASLRITEDKDEHEDEAMDPSNTLKMFSFSQPTSTPSNRLIKEEDESSSEEEQEDNLGDSFTAESAETFSHFKSDSTSLSSDRKPRLQEALDMSLKKSKASSAELNAPPTSSEGAPKKPRGEQQQTSTTLPVDWTLKSSIFLNSSDTFAWCDGVTAMDEIESMQLFISGVKAGSSPRVRLLKAMHHWIYPTNTATTPQAQSINRLLKNAEHLSLAEKSSVSEMFSRTAEWRQAFKSVYQACRNGACPYFYYVGSSWTVLFQHGSVSTSGDLEAILTNSTPGLRKVLVEEEIPFIRLPDAGGKTAVHNFSSKHDLEGFGDEDQESKSSTSGSTFKLPVQEELSNTLLFRGQVEVQGLFSYLLNLKTSFEDGFMYSSPTLITNVPFLHAALRRNTVSKCRLVSKNVEGTDIMQREYRIEIRGTLLPTSVKDLCGICNEQQLLTGYKFTAQSDTRSHGLNLRPLHKDNADSGTKLRDHKTHSLLSENPFIGTKALDQFKFDASSQTYSWNL
ncbi:hypothetical protein BGZ83_006070 [Gryganskiella cystojenkinii]|nr:hypothetical protein BGZ83_006070 [Gryganskiella cystojenkinii]